MNEIERPSPSEPESADSVQSQGEQSPGPEPESADSLQSQGEQNPGPEPESADSLQSQGEQSPGPEPDDGDLGVAPGAKVCGNCRLFKPVMRAAEGTWRGDCRLMRDRGMLPASAPTCGSFLARAAPIPRALKQVTHPAERRPRVAPTVRPVRPDFEIPELTDMTREELKEIIREARWEPDVRLAPRWEGGTVVVKPANPELQAKEIPVDALFHKVVMVRDRLRVLEQKVNAHPKLSDAEKVEMQQYVTRCYGSLTTFNLLFADKEEQFAGEKGKGD